MRRYRKSANARFCGALWRPLAALGIDANAVEDVILTHLHYDHVGNFDRFPKAQALRRVVQILPEVARWFRNVETAN